MTATKTFAQLEAELASMTQQRDDADRRAGAAERSKESLVEESHARASWLRKAKAEAGYDDNVSFDVVWKETLKKARTLESLGSLDVTKSATLADAGIKLCPFCGSKPDGTFRGPLGLSAISCRNRDCLAHSRQVSIEVWNTRYSDTATSNIK